MKVNIELFSSRFEQVGDCLEWQKSCTNAGYGQTMIDGKMWLTHRLSYTLAYGEIPENMMVRHTCDNRKCGDPDHLILGTNKQNMQDRLDHGHSKAVTFSGEQHHHAKLTDDLVVELRSRIGAGEKAIDIANEWEMDISTVTRAATGRTWNHVPGALPEDFLETKGARSGQSKLSEDQVRAIRRRYAEHPYPRQLAEEFGVNRGTIRRVVNRINYAEVN